MKTFWIEQKIKYDGQQLHSLYAYLQHKILGDSIVSWQGPCDIPFAHMVDGEDLLQQSEIRGADMLHFIVEMFDRRLREAVFAQRLFASIVKDTIESLNPDVRLLRQGDDLYWNNKKLSISIATQTPVSAMIHFAVNVANHGTPVPTCALTDWKIDPIELSKQCMKKFSEEYQSVVIASQKVKPVG